MMKNRMKMKKKMKMKVCIIGDLYKVNTLILDDFRMTRVWRMRMKLRLKRKAEDEPPSGKQIKASWAALI
uniref:Uncharacterized protein n=1 Tax=Heterorhabditis bacteriophora TaxID=37862 RepID=A0A1I7WMQ6_HETBA